MLQLKFPVILSFPDRQAPNRFYLPCIDISINPVTFQIPDGSDKLK